MCFGVGVDQVVEVLCFHLQAKEFSAPKILLKSNIPWPLVELGESGCSEPCVEAKTDQWPSPEAFQVNAKAM
jgi:hypothetical protein